MTPQDRFEIVYADVTGEAVESLPQFRCKAIDSYLDPKMSKAYLFFKAADERAEKMERCLDDLTDYVNSGCICGRAPDPKNPVDPRLLRKARRTQADTRVTRLTDALSSLILFSKPTKTNAVALNHCRIVLAEVGAK